MAGWIDFKELRSKLDFGEVLKHYGVEVRRKGNQHHGFCPLPNHQGKRNSPSFSANLEKGIFQCFGCGAKGNLLDFAVLMSKGNPKDSTALRKAAAELQARFCPANDGKLKKETVEKRQPKAEPKSGSPAIVNAPLDFELKGLDPDHPYLLDRGFTTETVRHFGLGHCSRGFLKGRVAVPLHDADAKLIGYAGRIVDDAAISEDDPRYKFPGARERDGKLFEFRKTLFLYNGFRFKTPLDDLIVVEGFTSVWWVHQCGLPRVVGVMGSDCSERQGELIVSLVKPTGRAWLMPDGNEAGERCALALFRQVSPHRFVRWVRLERDEQPTDLTAELLKRCFTR
jgi:DNA primase